MPENGKREQELAECQRAEECLCRLPSREIGVIERVFRQRGSENIRAKVIVGAKIRYVYFQDLEVF